MSGTILITGATSGFGEATARRFIREGWKVIGTGRRAERLQALAAELGSAFYGAAFDITDEDAAEKALAAK
jgi:serine 3-dehydrogenase